MAKSHIRPKRIVIALLLLGLPIFFLIYFQYFSKASAVKADIVVDTKSIVGFINQNWLAIAQGGEEVGTPMLHNIVPQLKDVQLHYIRLDHIYDIYDVVSRNDHGALTLNWKKLDDTVCDIYNTGATPFFSLTYMPPTMSVDGSLISQPKNWNEWSYLVQKTIERYSGLNTTLCGGTVNGDRLAEIYYEVWNEPDLESFGKWSLYGGDKDYKTLYNYSVQGANKAQDVHRFFIGGPVTTDAYKSWMQNFLDYIDKNNLRIDFLSWHHYTKNADEYAQDVQDIDSWLSDDRFAKYRSLPKIISEWGYDSNPNPVADTNVGAAHTVASIKNLLDQKLELAFGFEAKDGPNNPSWGILSYQKVKKPRYYALQLLNTLDKARLKLTGEGTYVRAIASSGLNKTTVLLVNYDIANTNTEQVPITLTNLDPGSYTLTQTFLRYKPEVTTKDIDITGSDAKLTAIMPPNTIVSIELSKK